MFGENRLRRLKTLLGIKGDEEDELLLEMLDMAKDAILNYLYEMVGGIPSDVYDIPDEYVHTQIMAVVVGYGLLGAEGQIAHNENGINRQFSYPDMLAYVRRNVIAYAGGVYRANAAAE